MTVNEYAKAVGARVLTMPHPEREITGGYSGDLLSWVMGRAKEGQLWVTIMTNINVLAVASLLNLSCVILTENAEVTPEFVARAEEEEINLLLSEEDTFSLCAKSAQLI